jgi:hypothetical protein
VADLQTVARTVAVPVKLALFHRHQDKAAAVPMVVTPVSLVAAPRLAATVRAVAERKIPSVTLKGLKVKANAATPARCRVASVAWAAKANA